MWVQIFLKNSISKLESMKQYRIRFIGWLKWLACCSFVKEYRRGTIVVKCYRS